MKSLRFTHLQLQLILIHCNLIVFEYKAAFPMKCGRLLTSHFLSQRRPRVYWFPAEWVAWQTASRRIRMSTLPSLKSKLHFAPSKQKPFWKPLSVMWPKTLRSFISYIQLFGPVMCWRKGYRESSSPCGVCNTHAYFLFLSWGVPQLLSSVTFQFKSPEICLQSLWPLSFISHFNS